MLQSRRVYQFSGRRFFYSPRCDRALSDTSEAPGSLLAPEVVLATYAHFMPDDDDRAREIMNAFFRRPSEGSGDGSCAANVPGGLS